MKDCNRGCAPYSGGWIVPPFWSFTQFVPTIPKLYWNVRSQEQRILNLFELINKVICYADVLGENVNELYKMIDELRENLESPEFVEHCIELVQKWIDEHMPDIIAQAVKLVYFGLTADGHFCAYIPDSWNDITFDTGAVYGRTDYGRLILRFEADGAIDNTYSYSLAQPTEVEQLIADLEVNARRTDAAFDTLFTNLDEDVVLNGNI